MLLFEKDDEMVIKGPWGSYIPQTETRTVAKRTERTKGANTIAPANMK